ncbi:hypothetical protein [Desertihabitans aurantiacus]|uniref:hypothetical protein n=1 Tax=Desertihabitans aurantiacus TaxID=2282477 RepID=UPI000DF812E1|nr:hypothetical protein [Desertihabitans aurantiacus]
MNRTIVHLLALTAVALTVAVGTTGAAASAGGVALAVLAGAVLLTRRHLFDSGSRGPKPQPVPVRVRVDGRRPR